MLQLEAPVNTTAILGQSQQLVPDVATQAAQRQLMQAQAAAANQQLQFRQIALQRQQSFGQDMQNFLQAPNASGVAQLFGKYPEFQQQISDAWNTMDTAQKRSSVSTIGSIIQMAKAGDTDGAANALQQKISADDSAGQDTTVSRQMLAELQSGDPKRINAAIGTGALVIGAAYPDKAKDFLSSIGLNQEPIKTSPGEKATNPVTGQTVASSPALNTSVMVKPGETPYAFNPNPGAVGESATPPPTQPGGGGPTSGAGAAAGGMQASVAHVLGNEGNQANGGWNPRDANGSPTNWGINFKANKAVLASMGFNASNFKSMTQDQAAQIYATKYWPQSGAQNLPANMQAAYFDAYVRSPALAKSILAKTGPDPVAFTQAASQAFQKMAANPNSSTHLYTNAWANRDAGNVALASGQNPNAVPNARTSAPVANAGPQPTSSAFTPLLSQGTPPLNTEGAEPGHAWNPTHTGEITVSGSDADPATYAAEIDPAARNFIFTGQYPTGGGGGGGGQGGGQLTIGEKNAINARAMQIWTAAGHSPEELKTFRQQYAGLSSSLQNATTTLSSLQSARDALQRDANLVLTTQRALARVAPNNPHGMGIVSDSGFGGVVPVTTTNRHWLTYYHDHGTPQQQAAVKAYTDAVSQYGQSQAKYMTAANGVGGSAMPSDASQAAAKELNDEGLGPTAMRTHLQTVLSDADNKVAGYGDQVKRLSAQLTGLGGLNNVPSIPAAAAQFLIKNPQLRGAFDAKYGAGAAGIFLQNR